MHPDDHLEALRREGAAMAAALGHDLSAEVPSCPGWTLETLANHLGRVHRWVTVIVRTRATERPDFPTRPPVVDHEWFEEGITELAAALEEAGPEAECWTLMGDASQARFWFRRQAMETAVHRWDAEGARGEPQAVETELAVDGVDELLDLIFPTGIRFAAEEPTGFDGTVHLHATDSPHGEWLVRLDGRELLVGHGHEKGDAAVRGTASDLFLWLWGRIPPDRLEVFGDGSLPGRMQQVLRAP